MSAFTARLAAIQHNNKEGCTNFDWSAVGGNKSTAGNNTSTVGNSNRAAAGKQQGGGYLWGDVSNPGEAFEEAL